VPIGQYVDPGLQASQDVAARAMALKLGDVIPGDGVNRPQEEALLPGRGMMLQWIGSGWMVIESPEAQAARGSAPHPSLQQAPLPLQVPPGHGFEVTVDRASGEVLAAVVSVPRAGEGVQPDIDISVDFSNPIGSWLVGVEQKLNEKLAKYNLRGRIVVDLAR
jgi:hypothetical protein